ncbi:hypothetical protein ACE38V_12805 [Cytobacillus sp. Hz8]|uniref:hypothetical protein n=1 Tax=Cytobacillus sp. Hz8 TaxID=3347168 RepID=UPI0035D98AE6
MTTESDRSIEHLRELIAMKRAGLNEAEQEIDVVPVPVEIEFVEEIQGPEPVEAFPEKPVPIENTAKGSLLKSIISFLGMKGGEKR